MSAPVLMPEAFRQHVAAMEDPAHEVRKCAALLGHVCMAPNTIEPECLAPLADMLARSADALIASRDAMEDALGRKAEGGR